MDISENDASVLKHRGVAKLIKVWFKTKRIIIIPTTMHFFYYFCPC